MVLSSSCKAPFDFICVVGFRGGGRSCQLGEQIASAKREAEFFCLLIFIREGVDNFARGPDTSRTFSTPLKCLLL